MRHADFISEGGGGVGWGGVGSGTLVGCLPDWSEIATVVHEVLDVLVLNKQRAWRFILKVQAAVSWTSGSDDIQTVLHSTLCLSVDVHVAALSHVCL